MVDTCIAVGIALLTLVTAYLGMHLTMHPADTDKKKTVYKVAFVPSASAFSSEFRLTGIRRRNKPISVR